MHRNSNRLALEQWEPEYRDRYRESAQKFTGIIGGKGSDVMLADLIVEFEDCSGADLNEVDSEHREHLHVAEGDNVQKIISSDGEV